MHGGLKLKAGALAVAVASAMLIGGGASAADLGGNCCADLEERIAELEATTARKGNRKVSLTVSGWVAEQVMYWDDGEEANIYVGGIGATLASHVKFTGQATISPGWTAGYVLQIEATGNENLLQNQDNDNAAGLLCGGSVCLMQSYWFLKSDHLGKVNIGTQSMAADNAAVLVDGSGSLVPANWVVFDVLGFGRSALNPGATNPNSIPFFDMQNCRDGGAVGDCFGVPRNSVRYDSPTFGGFSFSASWGADDLWDVAARYAGEFSGFKLAGTVSYAEGTNADSTTGNDHSEYLQIGAYIQHVPTGLFVYGAYGDNEIDDDVNLGGNSEQDTYYIKAGIRQRWTPLGHTVLYGEYLNNQVDFDGPNGAFAGVNGSVELEWWGLGVVQEIDAAAMSLWLSYRHYEADTDGLTHTATGSTEFDDFDMIKFGALINF